MVEQPGTSKWPLLPEPQLRNLEP